MAERDYARDDIDDREQTFIHRVTSDVIDDIESEPEVDLATLASANNASANQPPPIPKGTLDGGSAGPVPVKILALPANDKTDILVLKMLNCLLQPGSRMTVTEEGRDPLEGGGARRPRGAEPGPDLAPCRPTALTAACYLVRRLRARHPKLKIAVGRWGDTPGAEGSAERLIAVGASAVFHTLAEARDHVNGLINPNPRRQGPGDRRQRQAPAHPRRRLRPDRSQDGPEGRPAAGVGLFYIYFISKYVFIISTASLSRPGWPGRLGDHGEGAFGIRDEGWRDGGAIAGLDPDVDGGAGLAGGGGPGGRRGQDVPEGGRSVDPGRS